MRQIFEDETIFYNKESFNQRAGQMFARDPKQFLLEVKKCVQKSQTEIYQQPKKYSMKFRKYNSVHKKILDITQEIAANDSLTDQQKQQELLSYILKKKYSS